MTSRLYSVDEVVANMQDRMEIPGPVDDIDDWSGDEFEGYMNSDDEARDHGEDRDVGEMQSEEEVGEGGVGAQESDSEIPRYTSRPGCTQPAGDRSPLHYFEMLVTDATLYSIVTQTDLYARQYTDTHTITPRSRVQQWYQQEFNRDELVVLCLL